ncbi:winged helix-turn-helix domain-containing protein, partial [Serratia sp. IR-2025]
FAGKKSAQIREILISESAWEEMTCLFAPSLMRAPKRAFSRQTLLNMCLPESDAFERVVDTHIYNLRKKLNSVGVEDVLLTVRAMGYRYWNK